jgi:hypothetical protein
MGTRSVTIFIEDNYEVCRIYRQYDGYPEGHGIDLAKACKRKLTQGISGGRYHVEHKKGEQIGCLAYQKRCDAADKKYAKTHANGMGELAALVLCDLKNANQVGNVYLEPTQREVSDWVEYVYVVREAGETVQIDIRTKSGPFPFNLKDDDFIGSYKPDELIKAFTEHKEQSAA